MKVDVNSTAVLVCSGLKHEIFPATLSIPKALYPLGDTPLVLVGLSRFYSLGIKKVVLVVSRSDRTAIECLIGNGEVLGMSVTYFYQDTRKGLSCLINSLLKTHSRIVVRMVDFLDTNLSREIVSKGNNVVFKSNSRHHYLDAEYVFNTDVNLNEDFDISIENSEIIEIKKSKLINPLYLYNTQDMILALTHKNKEILEQVKANFGQTFLYKIV